MTTDNKFLYPIIFITILGVLYIIGSGLYILLLLNMNNNIYEYNNCTTFDLSDGLILEKAKNVWFDKYNIVTPSSGSTILKCPTDYPVVYYMFNDFLIGSMETDEITTNYNISINNCNNNLQYTMRISEFISIYINNQFLLASVDIKHNDRTIYYVKHDIYKTNNIDLYNRNHMPVANLLYKNKQWDIKLYNNTHIVDYNILLSLATYHDYYINGFTLDGCNIFVQISYALLFCFAMLLCCSCIVYIGYLYNNNNTKNYQIIQ